LELAKIDIKLDHPFYETEEKIFEAVEMKEEQAEA
jgi:hypothetical protein